MKPKIDLQLPRATGPFPRALRLQRHQTDAGLSYRATPEEIPTPMPSQTDRALTTATSHASALARDNARLRTALTQILTTIGRAYGLDGVLGAEAAPAAWCEPDATVYTLAQRALATETPHREW